MKIFNRISISIVIIGTIFILCSCAIFNVKKPEPAAEKDPYEDFPPIFPVREAKTGEEVTPEPKGKKEPKATATPRPKVIVKARILEYHKATKVVYINVGSSRKGIKVGLKGKVYNDKALTQENGIITLTRVYPDFSEGVAKNQNYEINPTAAIAVFEIDT